MNLLSSCLSLLSDVLPMLRHIQTLVVAANIGKFWISLKHLFVFFCPTPGEDSHNTFIFTMRLSLEVDKKNPLNV